MSEKSKTNIEVNPREMAMKAGADAGGAVKSDGALDGRFERSMVHYDKYKIRNLYLSTDHSSARG